MSDYGSVAPSLLIAQVLGEFRVAIGGRAIGSMDWHHGSAERLLKLILVTPRHRLRREVAAELLWPGSPSGRGAVNLRRAYHFLGRALEPDPAGGLLLHEASMVGLAPTVDLDLDLDRLSRGLDRLDRTLSMRDDGLQGSSLELSAAADAVLAVGGGELLPDDGHEDWLATHRDHLLIRWEEVLLRSAAALDRCGERIQAAALVRQVLATDPADEDAHRLAIQLYVQGGHHHAARRQLQACRRAMRDAYGLDPSPSTFAALRVEPSPA
ncbi:MAG: AfsR/SARP family transcriptional regulator [Candidatus Limnocylindria bacterium]